MMSDQTSVLDTEVLEGLMLLADDDDPDFVRDLIDTYLGELPSYMAALREAVAASDLEAVRRAAHRLKGSSANIGAAEMAERAAEMEHSAKSGGADWKALMDAVEHACVRADGALRAVLADL